MQPQREARILQSWMSNVSPWTSSVREQRIESRTLVTNQVSGEGWLVRALAEHVPERIGVDAVPGLIERAEAAGGGAFRVASYGALAQGALLEPVDLAVCNFSLFGHHSVEQLLAAHATFLRPAGVLLVQTLHPLQACGSSPYRDGWREGSWAGFDAGFVDPAPWYFRTLESWTALFRFSGLRLLQIREPLHPTTGRPASVLFEAMTPGQRQSSR